MIHKQTNTKYRSYGQFDEFLLAGIYTRCILLIMKHYQNTFITFIA